MLRNKILLAGIITIVAIFFSGNALWAQTISSLPIEGARGLSFDQNRSIAYIVNGDNTISAYGFIEKKFLFSRTPLSGVANIKQILTSPSGSMVALVYYTQAAGYRVAVYSVLLNSEKGNSIIPGPNYFLGNDLIQGTMGMAFSSDGKMLFVGYGENTLYIFSTDISKQERITVGQFPSVVAIGNDGKVLVLNKKSEDLSIVDPFKRVVRATVKLGVNPQNILFNKITNMAYISHIGSDDIYVVDTTAAKVVRKIKADNDPASLAYDERDGTVFAANNSSGTLSIISPDFKIKTVDLKSAAYFQSAPLTLAYLNSEKKLFILNTSEAKYLVYDVKQSRIIKEDKTETFPVKIFISEKTKSALILHWNANSLFVIDAETFATMHIPDSVNTTAVLFFSKPQSIAADVATNRIFVSNLGGDYITVINGDTQKPIAKITVGRSIQNVFLNKTTRKLYAVSPPNNTVTVINISKNDYPTKIIQLEQQPRGGAINEKTNKIYYPNSAVARMSVVDGSKDEVGTVIDFPAGSFPLVNYVDEGRNKIYVALYGGSSVAIVDGENNKIEKLISVGANPIWVRYIPQIDRVFVSVEGEKKVLVINPNGNEIIQTIPISGKPYRIFFDTATNYVYINRREEDTVTILRIAEASDKFEVVDERAMAYWGQTDARPYNMLVYNEQTRLAYFTTGERDKVIVTKVAHDNKNILQATWFATINAGGDVVYSQAANGELAQKSRRTLYMVIGVIIILISVIVAIILFRRKRVEV